MTAPRDVLDVVYHDEVRRCRVGSVAACLMRDGTVTLRGNRLIDAALRGLTASDLQDLIVALDGVLGEQPDPKPAGLREAIIGGAHALARDVYRMSATPAVVDVRVDPAVFYAVAGVPVGNGQSVLNHDDYYRGSVRVTDDVEISINRSRRP